MVAAKKTKRFKSPLAAAKKLNKKQLGILVAAFAVIGVGAFYWFKSHAGAYANCNGGIYEMPGSGLTPADPELISLNNNAGQFSNSLVVVVRGMDNAVYYQAWHLGLYPYFDGVWAGLGGKTYNGPSGHAGYAGSYSYPVIEVVGTDGAQWANIFDLTYNKWNGWARTGSTYYTGAVKSFRIDRVTYSVGRNAANNRIYYSCLYDGSG